MSDPLPPRPFTLRNAAKAAIRILALVAVSPILLLFWLDSALRGPDRAIESSSQFLALFPGSIGQYLRRAFLQRALTSCHSSALVEFGTIFSQADGVIEENVYVGPYCILGLVHLEKDVLIASGVQIPSGAKTHFFDDLTKPIREQGGERRLVRVGADSWIGAGAIVMADVGKGTVVAAGAVVVKPLPDYVIAGGIPAKIIGTRSPGPVANELA